MYDAILKNLTIVRKKLFLKDLTLLVTFISVIQIKCKLSSKYVIVLNYCTVGITLTKLGLNL